MVEKCPRCNSVNTSSDVELEWIEDAKNHKRYADVKIKREFDFCFDCGFQWNFRKSKE